MTLLDVLLEVLPDILRKHHVQSHERFALDV